MDYDEVNNCMTEQQKNSLKTAALQQLLQQVLGGAQEYTSYDDVNNQLTEQQKNSYQTAALQQLAEAGIGGDNTFAFKVKTDAVPTKDKDIKDLYQNYGIPGKYYTSHDLTFEDKDGNEITADQIVAAYKDGKKLALIGVEHLGANYYINDGDVTIQEPRDERTNLPIMVSERYNNDDIELYLQGISTNDVSNGLLVYALELYETDGVVDSSTAVIGLSMASNTIWLQLSIDTTQSESSTTLSTEYDTNQTEAIVYGGTIEEFTQAVGNQCELAGSKAVSIFAEDTSSLQSNSVGAFPEIVYRYTGKDDPDTGDQIMAYYLLFRMWTPNTSKYTMFEVELPETGSAFNEVTVRVATV